VEENTHCERNAVYVIEEGSEDAYVRVQEKEREKKRERERGRGRQREREMVRVRNTHLLIGVTNEASLYVTSQGGVEGVVCRLLFGGF